MTLGEAPAIEDQVVLCDLRQRHVERSARRRRQDDIVKRSTRNHGLDSAATRHAEQAGKRGWRHASTVPPPPGTINRVLVRVRSALNAGS